MRIVNCQDTAFYRPHHPPACAGHADRWDSPLYRLVEEHYEEFERVYPDRFQARYGFWRPVWGVGRGAWVVGRGSWGVMRGA